jgi:hypothetical protein
MHGEKLLSEDIADLWISAYLVDNRVPEERELLLVQRVEQRLELRESKHLHKVSHLAYLLGVRTDIR